MVTMPQRIGPYEVDREIGRGGMGVVYGGRDTRLGRPVAIKTIAGSLAHHASRLARFEREARTLAAVQHPNIATVYGVEEVGQEKYLIMELVAGETLNERLAHGALPMQDALSIGLQIAAGVEAAHEAGVIHRDLKPGNVVITEDDKVKVLDFGLARELERQQPPSITDVRGSEATIRVAHTPVTQEGTVLGTPGYMSPEQARGKPLDKRTDIFSFGCVLYECLTGRPVFGGETATDVLAAVLERDPDWSKLPGNTPIRVRELLSECLVKNAMHRLRDIGDARIELERAIDNREWSSSTIMMAADMPVRRRKSAVPKVLAAVVIGVIAGAIGWQSALQRVLQPRNSPPRPVTRLSLDLASPVYAYGLAVSPDGRTIVHSQESIVDENGQVRLMPLLLRRLDEFESRPMPGTEGAFVPRFSPDGRWVLYLASDEADIEVFIKKVDLEGNPPITLSTDGRSIGVMTWLTNDEIFVVEVADLIPGLMPARGGQISPIGTRPLGDIHTDWISNFAETLPGGRHVILSRVSRVAKPVRADLLLVDVKTGEHRVLLRDAFGARYVSSGHLCFIRDGSLYATRFEVETLHALGEPVVFVTDINGVVEISALGDLFYQGMPHMDERQFVLVDTDGRVRSVLPRKRWYNNLRVSPDGKWMGANVWNDSRRFSLHIFSVDGQQERRIFGEEHDQGLYVWMGDSREVAYLSRPLSNSDPALMAVSVIDSAKRRIATLPPALDYRPISGSPDGNWFTLDRIALASNQWETILVNTTSGEPRELFKTSGSEWGAMFSPNGKWIAYASDESGRNALIVQEFDSQSGQLGARWTVMGEFSDGYWRWSRTGSRLYFVTNTDLTAIDISAGSASPVFSQPRKLFDLNAIPATWIDAGPDDETLVAIRKSQEETTFQSWSVVLNWAEELKRRLPVEAK